MRRTACPTEQDFASERNFGILQCTQKADTVRIIADEVLAAFHGVDRAVKQGFAVYLIEQGKNCSLVRDGEIEAAQSSQGGELLCKLLRWQLPLFINSVHAVNGKKFSWMKGDIVCPSG